MRLSFIVAILFPLLPPASAEVVYTPANISVPVGGAYILDVNRDGVADFTLRSHLLQSYCQFGDGYEWNLSVNAAAGNLVAATNEGDAAALPQGASIDFTQLFSSGTARMSELDWGWCGRGFYGQWLNSPNRYLGLELRRPGSLAVYYGWAKVAEAAYVDQSGHLHATVILQGFAYETIAGKAIVAGQTSD